MNKLIISFVAFFVLTFSSTIINAGEPVIGAEVFVEQEPTDQPIVNGKTGLNGIASAVLKVDKQLTKNLNLFVKIPPIVLQKIALKHGKTDHIGTYHFRVSYSAGTKTLINNCVIVIKRPADLLKLSKTYGGPYSQSVSNIEDKTSPVQIITVPVRVLVTLEKIN